MGGVSLRGDSSGVWGVSSVVSGKVGAFGSLALREGGLAGRVSTLSVGGQAVKLSGACRLRRP